MDVNNIYGTLEIQKELLGLLKQFHSFCLENNIKYSLDWGSLLGAVRHKGFIPWDDDIDVMVDRQNYKRIIQKINDNSILMIDDGSSDTLWIKRIRYLNEAAYEGYPPTIDILVMDYAPNNKLFKKLKVFVSLFLQGMLKEKPNYQKGNVILRLCTLFTHCIGKLFTREQLLKWYDILALSNKSSQEVSCYFEEYSCMGRYYPHNLLDNIISMEFEDTVAYIVKDYHECLTIQFGVDYMTPPHMNDRIPRHLID